MAAKIVDQMKEKMQLAGQTALLASMIPKRDGPSAPASGKPLAQMMSAQAKEPTQTPGGGGDVQDGYITANLHLPLALRKQRRPNAGLKPHHPFVTKKLKKVNTVKQLKDELRNQQVKSQQNKIAIQSAMKSREERKKKLKMKRKLKQAGRDHVDSFRKKKMIRTVLRDGKTTNDCYCWICHKEGTNAICQACPRVFHRKCIQTYPHDFNPAKVWFCPECEAITYAECADTQSKSLSLLSDEDLRKLLQCALNRMKHSCAGPFLYPVSQETAPNYLAYIFNPMDLTTIEKNVNDKVYGSPEAFLADVKWIAHNCIIYNGSSNKLTKSAQLIVQIAEHEIKEVQLCPDCYLFSCSKKKNWFCFPCRTMHTLVWAKLKGFPFWPAKVLREKDGRLDVRFFGQHDRAWVLVQDCYLISKEMPFPPTNNKTSGLSQAVREVEIHMQMIRDKHRKCEYSPFRTPYDVNRTYAHRNVVVTKKESAVTGKGKKRKRKGVIKKATYIPVLRDLDPPSQEAMDVDVEDEEDGDKEKSEGNSTEQSLKSEKQGSQNDEEREGTEDVSGEKRRRVDEEGEEESSKQYRTDGEGKGLKNAEGGKRGDSAEGGVINEKEREEVLISLKEDESKEDRLSSHPKQPPPEGVGKKPQGELVSSRVNISRKVYSKSGKVLELGSNISQEVGTVVEGGTLEQGEKEKTVESREGEGGKVGVDSSSGTGKESTGGTPGEVKIVPQSGDDVIVKSTKETDNVQSKENSGAPETTPVEDDKAPIVLKSDSSAIASPASTSKSAELPLSILPNKLPDPKKLEVKTEQLSPKVTESTGTQVTPQKTDRFNEKLNETIKSCRKFLGLESESAEKPLDSDDESVGKSEQESELDSSQDEEDEDKVDSEEGGASRRATPSSLVEWDSPISGVSSLKASLGFDSDSEDDTTDKELVIDEDGGNASGAEMSKEDDKQERKGSSERLSSPKLMIKLPFGSKGRQSLSDAGSKKDEEEEDVDEDDDDDFDGDKEIAGDVVERGKASEVKEAISDSKGAVDDKKDEVEEMETDESKKENVASLEKGKVTVEVAEYDDDDDDDNDVMEIDTVTLEDRLKKEEGKSEKMDSAEGIEQKDQVTAGSSEDVKVEHSSEVKLSDEGETKIDAKLEVVDEKAEVKVVMDSEKSEAEVTTASTEEKNEEVICLEDGGKVEEPIDVVVKDILRDICEKVEEAQERSPSEGFDKKLAELEAKVEQLRMKLMIERQEALEKKASYELTVYEIFENYQVLIRDTVSRLTKEHETEMLDVKRKQWCAYCQKEAVFFCCWNTSYCDYPCQQKHWALHQRVCQQTANATQSSTSTTATTSTNSSITTNPLQVSQVISGPQVPMDQLGQVQQRPPAVSNLIQYVGNVPKIFVPMQASQAGPTLHMSPSQSTVATQNLRMGPPSVTGTAPQSFHVTPSQVTGGGQNIHMGPPHMQPPPMPASVQTSPPQILSQHQYRPMASQYQQNSQGPTLVSMPPPGSLVRQRMSDGKEVILHIPQNIRLSVPT